jgi:general secretion pathway protein B
MSLILEALKKAEQERNAGQAPAMQQVLTRPMPAARQRQQREQRHLLLVVGTCIAITLAALVFALWPRHTTPTETAAVTQTASSPPVVAAAAQPVSEAAPSPTFRVDPERLRSFDTQPGNGAAGGNATDSEAAEASTLDDLAEDRPSSPRPTPVPATRRAAENRNVIVPSPPDEPDAGSATPNQPVDAAPAASSAAAARPLQDMPVSFRAELPKLMVDVHVYDDNPLKRFAIVNGKKYREGDTLVEGPRIAAITANGVVIEHKGSQVLLELPH